MPRQTFYTVGGTVQAGGGRYLTRQVDDILLDLCLRREFAFVLTARQMGKSSLMVRTAERLSERGVASVIIDLSQIGVQVTPNEWYLGVLSTIEEALDLDTDVFEWWDEHERVGLGQRLTKFFEEVVAAEVDGPVVIFIDEIDSTLSLPFTDDFFTAIRYVYNARSGVPEFEKLSFVLIGVASPSDLISDPARTPFNIGHRVDVDYFSPQEAAPLAQGFGVGVKESAQLLHWVLRWTGGHPYLTQRLCAAVSDVVESEGAITEHGVDAVVRDTFFGEKSDQDSNLRFVHDMLTQRSVDVTAVLQTYQRIVEGKAVADDRQSAIISHIKLSGVAARKDRRLVVRNRIYEHVFDKGWIKEQWPEHWIKRVPPAVIGLVAASFLALIFLGVAAREFDQRGAAQELVEQTSKLNAELAVENRRSDSLNVELTEEVQISDSLRSAEELLNLQLVNQITVSNSLRLEAEEANVLLTRQVLVSDSLRSVETQANQLLSEQISVSDSLREIAEERFDAAKVARLETITIALASKATRQLTLGDSELGALLARQAYVFSQQSGGEFLDPVYDALRQSLNAVSPGVSSALGGPYLVMQHRGGVRAVGYDPTGQWIASVAEDGTVGLGSSTSRDRSSSRVFHGHTAAARSLAFSWDGRDLVTGGDDGRIILWSDLESATPTSSPIATEGAGVWALAFEPDGSRLASGGADGQIILWELASGTGEVLPVQLKGRIRTLAFSSDGEMLYTGTDRGEIASWRIGGDIEARGSIEGCEGSGVLSIAVSPTGRRIAAGCENHVVLLRDVMAGIIEEAPSQKLEGHEGPVNSVAFGSSDDQLASGSMDHSAQLWNLATDSVNPIVLQQHTSWVWSVDFDVTGNRLLTGSDDRSVLVWNTRPQEMAEAICSAVSGRELTESEWFTYVGEDFAYGEVYAACTSGTPRISASEMVDDG